MSRLLLVLSVLLLLAGAGLGWLTHPRPGFAIGQPMTYTADSVGPPNSGAPVEIWKPEGAGPFPAVVLLHGSGGVPSAERQWARRLVSWGYAAVILDSFRPRCGRVICGHDPLRSPVSSATRAGDLVNLLPFLRTQPGIDGDRLAAIGFSQGAAATVLAAVEDPRRPQLLRAAVAYYTACRLPRGTRLSVDMIVLIGTADRIASVETCHDLVVAGDGGSHPVPVEFFKEAGHNFDWSDTQEARRSFAIVRTFLAAHLKAPVKAR